MIRYDTYYFRVYAGGSLHDGFWCGCISIYVQYKVPDPGHGTSVAFDNSGVLVMPPMLQQCNGDFRALPGNEWERFGRILRTQEEGQTPHGFLSSLLGSLERSYPEAGPFLAVPASSVPTFET